MGIAEVFTRCMETSTIPGLPIIVASHAKAIRISWIVFLLLSTFLFCYHSMILIRQFMLEETTTNEVKNVEPFLFPDMYICNGRPLSLSSMFENYSNSQREILTSLQNLHNFSTESSVIWSSLNAKNLLKAFGYLPYFKFSHDEFTVANDNTPNRIFFEDYIDYVQIPNHFSCFYYNMTKISSDFEFTKIVMIHFIDSESFVTNTIKFGEHFLDTIDYRYRPYFIKGHQGYRIYLTERNVYPHEGSVVVSASGGQSTKVELSMTKSTLLNTKSLPCSAVDTYVQYYNPLSTVSDFNEYRETFNDCRFKSALEILWQNESCQCIPYWMPVEKSIFSQYPTCGNISFADKANLTAMEKLEAKEIIRRGKECEKLLHVILQTHDFQDCNAAEPCTGYFYDRAISYADLDKQTMYDFLESNRFSDRSFSRGLISFLLSLRNVEKAKSDNALRANMVEVIIERKNRYALRKDDSLKYPISNLISEIGGIFGLYLGFSLLTICEVICLIHDLIYYAIQSKRRKENNYELMENEDNNENEF